MNKPLHFISGIILMISGFAIPILVAAIFIQFSSNFWLGLLFVMASFLLTSTALFFSAALVGPAYPEILDNTIDKSNRLSHKLITYLFKARFAGRESIWKIDKAQEANVFNGLWHGCILPISLGISLFSKRIQPYESNNNGFWYNFGYAISLYYILRVILIL